MAALYDIHGNLPALEAVLAEVRGAGVDRIVVGGDVLPGPLPRETAAEQFRRSAYPGAADYARELLEPPAEAEMLDLFG